MYSDTTSLFSSLSVGFVGYLEFDRLLCPVRPLKLYFGATRVLVPRSPRLFVSPRIVLKTHFFLREVISGAGGLGAAVGPAPKAPGIRGMSSSHTFHRDWSVDAVLKAATWRCTSVFASFYLRGISLVLDNVRSLGPFVSAGLVLASSSRFRRPMT